LLPERVAEAVASIDEALAGRPVPEALIVRRATDLTYFPCEPETMVGRTFEELAFFAASLGPATHKHREAVLHLRVPPGFPAIYMEALSANADGRGELLPGRGLQFSVQRAVFNKHRWHIFAKVER